MVFSIVVKFLHFISIRNNKMLLFILRYYSVLACSNILYLHDKSSVHSISLFLCILRLERYKTEKIHFILMTNIKFTENALFALFFISFQLKVFRLKLSSSYCFLVVIRNPKQVIISKSVQKDYLNFVFELRLSFKMCKYL